MIKVTLLKLFLVFTDHRLSLQKKKKKCENIKK